MPWFCRKRKMRYEKAMLRFIKILHHEEISKHGNSRRIKNNTDEKGGKAW